MKKLSLILVASILGTSSLALADHDDAKVTAPQLERRDHRNDRVRDQRYYNDDRDYKADLDDRDYRRDSDGSYWRDNQRYIRAERQAQWMDLGTVSSGKSVIKVPRDLGRIQSLRLDTSGWVRVRQVLVQYTDGTQQLVRMRTATNGRRAPLVVDLTAGKRLQSIIVYSNRMSRGTITVSGLEATRYFWRQQG